MVRDANTDDDTLVGGGRARTSPDDGRGVGKATEDRRTRTAMYHHQNKFALIQSEMT